ncbi:MAG: T9SS type A sorting domain-containing protein [Flavobacteriales bacterium]
MARSLLSALSFLLILSVRSQMWCPPGAQWNYSIQAFASSGSVVRTYMGDTLFQGLNAQRIHESGCYIAAWGTMDTVTINNDRFTSVQDSTLLLWTNTTGTWEWDTLHRFDAVIGDRWYPPGADSVCDQGYLGMLIVTGTGSMTVDGLTLRTWDIAYCDELGQPGWVGIHMIERLGSMGGLEIFPGGCIIFEYGETLECYTDAQVGYNDQNWPYGCASMVGIAEERGSPAVVVFPNPGSDHFTCTLPEKRAATLQLVDATGRKVMNLRMDQGTLDVNTTVLARGLFSYRIMDTDGTIVAAGTWVKE